MYEMIIKNAKVFDGEQFSEELKDIVIHDGKIKEVAKAGSSLVEYPAIDIKGACASIGFIDMHAHVNPLIEMGVYPESAMFPYGVTSAADAGSLGTETFCLGLERLAGCRADVRCFMNIAGTGLTSLRASYPEIIDSKLVNASKMKYLFEKYPDILCGIKIRYGEETVRGQGAEPLKYTCELARSLGVPVMVHTTHAAIPMDDLCDCLQAGDIVSHPYHSQGRTILDAEGNVLEGVLEAKNRGVLFDIGDAGYHFSFEIFREAFPQGLTPDTISTDCTNRNVFADGMVCLPYVMSKFLHLGMSLEEVLRCVTVYPGRILKLPEIIQAGQKADIAVFHIKKGDFALRGDQAGDWIHAERLINPLLTVKEGRIVWRSLELI